MFVKGHKTPVKTKAIDLPDGRRKCVRCYKPKPIEMFNRHKGGLRDKRCECSQCQSEKNTYDLLIKLANKNPQNYFQCDDCDRIMTVYSHSRPHKDGTRDIRCDCRYCGSKNIDDFLS